MNNGVFRLWIKRSEAHEWGLLEAFPWDGTYRRKAQWRKAMLNLAFDRQAGWVRNYTEFASAAFAIEEQDDPNEPPVHIAGSPRGRELREKLLREIESIYGRGIKLKPEPVPPPASPAQKGKVVNYRTWPKPKLKPGGLKRRTPFDHQPGGLKRRPL